MSETTNRVLTAATEFPVTLDEAKSHARVDIADDDALFTTQLIPGAVAAVEGRTGFAMMQQTWRYTRQYFPRGFILLRGAPFVSITDFNYINTAGDSTAMVAGTDYTLDAEQFPAQLWPYLNSTWPSVQVQPGAVTVDYVVGSSDRADVNAMHRLAVLELCSHYYEQREAVLIGQGVAAIDVPEAVDRLINTDRLFN